MAKPSNGHDPVQQKMLDVLIRIEARLGSVETEIRRLGDRILTGEFGQQVRDHGVRLLRVESELAELRHERSS